MAYYYTRSTAAKKDTDEKSCLQVPSRDTARCEYQMVTPAEIKSVMRALPGVSWRTCTKGHMFAVGECGSAVVNGRCIECNESV
ncbi:hypothetical protein EV175_006519, partial [Coemansia sp. RSA 1933]